jgi:hypothetical protein
MIIRKANRQYPRAERGNMSKELVPSGARANTSKELLISLGWSRPSRTEQDVVRDIMILVAELAQIQLYNATSGSVHDPDNQELTGVQAAALCGVTKNAFYKNAKRAGKLFKRAGRTYILKSDALNLYSKR